VPAVLVPFVVLAIGLSLASCQQDRPREFQPAPGPPRFETTIHVPAKLASIDTGKTDALGRPVQVACAVCHSLQETKRAPTTAAALEQFHRGLAVRHGTLACVSCHDTEEPQRLRLASGEVLPATEALRLCGQCHGPQLRSYERGAHGGMTGYWDLSRGPRSRNHCADCHDPHAPAIPILQPVHPPRDRFLAPGATHGTGQGAHP
jgi:hypothetical protein